MNRLRGFCGAKIGSKIGWKIGSPKTQPVFHPIFHPILPQKPPDRKVYRHIKSERTNEINKVINLPCNNNMRILHILLCMICIVIIIMVVQYRQINTKVISTTPIGILLPPPTGTTTRHKQTAPRQHAGHGRLSSIPRCSSTRTFCAISGKAATKGFHRQVWARTYDVPTTCPVAK